MEVRQTQFSSDYGNNLHQKVHIISPREVLLKYLPFLPWVLASVFLFLTLAFLKLRYSPKIYNVTGTILVKDPTAVGNRPDKIEEMLFTSPNKNINDEIQVIRSRNMARRVARSMGLEVQYYNQGKIRSSQLSLLESPIKLNIIYLKDSLRSFSMPVTVLNDKEFAIDERMQPLLFDQPFESSSGRFAIQRTTNNFSRFGSNLFFIDYSPAEQRAIQLVGGLSAAPSGESNNILQLTYATENTKIGIDIVNQWMREYQQAGLEDKKYSAVNALRFIDEQMDTVKFELGGVEKNLLGFRERNRIISPTQQSTQFFNTLGELDKEITKQSVQVQVVDNLISYISETRNPYRQVASTLGIEEPSLLAQIGEFNKLQVQRETILKTTTRANPLVVDLEAGIEKLRIDIIQNLRNVKQAFKLSIDNLIARNREAGKEIMQIPAKEKQLLDITRRQKILEELYSFLLQKKLETSISSASTISNVRVIEPAMAAGGPVSPNRRSTYTLALFLGLLLPAGVIFLLEFLNDKVKSRDDIQKATLAPIIGEIGHAEEKASLVVSRTSRRFIAEQFRIIRTNLQYVIPKQEKAVILVTSSSSGEGKSFVSTNIGAVMALTGKKTAILEFDIRKPKIMSGLSLPKKTGITNYIIGKTGIEDLPVQVPGIENLFVVPCGPVPPNPSELLLDERLDKLMQELKLQFDIIIIDTAPVGLVSDAILLGKYADASLYIIRHNYTYKKQLQLLNETFENRRLPKVSLVINDIRADGGYGKYYGYGGYGYTGYGYGYGTEYFEDENSGKRKSIFRFRLKGR
jgi:capsular exopolysaccharide synthesis family protein